jgi:hypothetical protein
MNKGDAERSAALFPRRPGNQPPPEVYQNN